MRLTVNGQMLERADGLTLGALLQELNLPAAGVVVERNHGIIARDALGDTALTDGDRLEIVRLVGGG